MIRIDNNTAISLSIDFIERYCRKDLSWIRPHIDERTFFIGPREGQIMRCGSDLMNAWISDHPMPDFSVRNIEASSVMTSRITCEVLLHYEVIWHKPDGTTLEHPQIMQISWFVQQAIGDRTDDSADHDHYKVAVMHLSNPEELDERDLVYNTFGDIATSRIGYSIHTSIQADTWIVIPGVNAVINRYPAGSILWMESSNSAHKSIAHTRSRDIRSSKPLSWFMEQYPGIFLQPSLSFIINPAFIKTVQRFTAELWNGKVLHIPQKKYGQFKKDLEAYLMKEKEDTPEQHTSSLSPHV